MFIFLWISYNRGTVAVQSYTVYIMNLVAAYFSRWAVAAATSDTARLILLDATDTLHQHGACKRVSSHLHLATIHAPENQMPIISKPEQRSRLARARAQCTVAAPSHFRLSRMNGEAKAKWFICFHTCAGVCSVC